MIRIYSQNVRKNHVLLDSLLESQKDLYDILFIQEPPWNFIRFAPFFYLFFFFCSSIYYTVLGRSLWQTIYNK